MRINFSGKHKKQRGVALVFTLGILGLLTVVALGFASTALINRKVAENCGNISYAQTIARSIALSKVMFALRNGVQMNQIYSFDIASTEKDFLWKLDTSLNNVSLFTFTPADTTNSMNKVTWQYVTDPGGAILGRYAYVIVPDKGRLDPSVNIADGTSIDGASEKQIGINNSTWSDSPGLLNSAVTGKYRWTTFWEVFNQLSTNITSAQKKTFFSDGVNIGQLKYPEAYWVDANKNGQRDSAEPLYKRFNLNRSDWETITVDKLIGSDNIAFSSGDTVDVMEGIPWLKNWSDSHDNWTAALMQKQIAANIIQYNRPESSETVTNFLVPTDWTTTAPEYAGVGKHPMLNEVGFKLNVQAKLTPTPFDTGSGIVYDYKLEYVFDVSFGTELIDMFQGLSAASERKNSEIILPSWAFKAAYTWLSVTDGHVFNSIDECKAALVFTNFDSSTGSTVGKTHSIDGSTWWNVPYTPYTKFWSEEFNVTKTITFRINSSDILDDSLLKIKDISVVPGNAVLKYDSKQRDFATLPNSSEDTTEYEAKKETTFTYALEANDPRVNHYASDWKKIPLSGGDAEKPQVTNTATIDYGGSPGTCNTLTGINASGRDKGTTTDPGYGISGKRIASAFIRHGTMQSVWELGCISRADAWRTLNLTSTNNAETPDYTYAKGDGKILDQVKLTESNPPEGPNFKYGKVNINSDVKQVFQALTDVTVPSGTLPRFTWFNTDFEAANTPQTLAQKNLLEVTTGSNLNSASTPIVSSAVCTEGDYDHNCLACLIRARSKILPFNNRSELLLDVADVTSLPGYSMWDSTKKTAMTDIHRNIRARMLSPMQYLSTPPSNSDSTTKAAQEQLLGKLMPLLRAEKSDMVYVIVLAQTLRDIGGTPAYIDWNGDGDYAAYNAPVSDTASLKKAGYVRTGETSSYISGASVHETYPAANVTVGTYEIGADKITSETKLIAVLVQDPVTRKWRIARYQYVEQ